MPDEKKPVTKLVIPKTWLNDKGQECRKCEWCPGTMILKSA